MLMASNVDSLPILYSFRRCPYAIRARLALAYAGTPVILREVLLRDKPAQLYQASPKATVPVLVITPEHVLEESLEILFWALHQHDPEDWRYHADPALQAIGQRLMATNDGDFKTHLDHYKYADRFPEHPRAHYRTQGTEFLGQLEALLAQHAFILGARLSFADIAIFPFVRQFAGVDPAWFAQSAYPAVVQWLAACVSSALFQTVMAKYPPWVEASSPVYFPA